jgi:hypothetical protein
MDSSFNIILNVFSWCRDSKYLQGTTLISLLSDPPHERRRTDTQLIACLFTC